MEFAKATTGPPTRDIRCWGAGAGMPFRAIVCMALLSMTVGVCFVFSGVAQAAPPDPHTVGATVLSNIELNGKPGTSFTVSPGEALTVSASWSDENTGCPGCIDFVATGFAGSSAAAGCIEYHHFDEESGTGEVGLGDAPTTPGRYDVVADFEEVFSCGEVWTSARSYLYPTIVEVTVPGSVPHWYVGENPIPSGVEATNDLEGPGKGKEGPVKGKEGPGREKTGPTKQVKTSGSLGLHLSDGTSVTCKVKGEETIENPSGSAGTDKTTKLTLAGCKEASKHTVCAKGEKPRVTAGGLPWASELRGGTPIRDQLIGVELTIECAKHEVSRVFDVLSGSVFPGVGTNVLEFGAGSGELSESLGGAATVTGTDELKAPHKIVITAKTP